MQENPGHPWHHLPAGQVVELLDGDVERGLDPFEVGRRQERHGPNVITPRRGRSAWVRFLLQFHHPLIYLLLGAAFLKMALGGWVDAGVILAVVGVNAVIGYLQEARAERAIEALARSLVTEATVVRAGSIRRVPSGELVVGDLVQVAAGDRVPADLRLVHTRDFQVSESALTGESVPVVKDAERALGLGTALADRSNMAYASTLATSGLARGVVVATADHTEIGRISGMMLSAPVLETPLTVKMAVFGRRLLGVILLLAGVVVALGVVRGEDLDTVASTAIALAVGSIPEGLPAAVTVTLAIGVARLARRRAIIRKLPAVETLGSTTVICSDKTGTLTQNEMTVKRVVVGGSVWDVTGSGYDPRGRLERHGTAVEARGLAGVSETLLAGVLCNDSALVEKDGRWEAHGDPTEVALVTAARKGGWDEEALTGYARIDAIPFESQNQYMATLHRVPGGHRRIYLKGAVEVVLARCAGGVDARGERIPLDRDAVTAAMAELAGAGMRVLAFARADGDPQSDRLEVARLPRDFVFLGLQGMMDPPRPEAMEAVALCRRAGIRVVMITGDHAGTAMAIGRQLGLLPETASPGADAVRTGRDLAELGDEALIGVAESVSVFARVTPEQKLRLVGALQSRGHVVAMTGDGVNDGPALRRANIGVAMGITGTEVAKEASDMVLTDDNFASLGAAVEEGRGVYDNLVKIVAWALPSNLGQGLVILAASVTGMTLPILPLQVLWINLTTGGLLGLFLALEPKEPDLMDRPPRPAAAPILDARLVGQVVLVGVLILVGAFGLFRWELARGAGIDAARTVALNTVAVIQAFYLLNCRSLRRPLFSRNLFSNPWLWVGLGGTLLLQAALTHLSVFNALFHTAPLGWDEWVRVLGAGGLALVVVEVWKWGIRVSGIRR